MKPRSWHPFLGLLLFLTLSGCSFSPPSTPAAIGPQTPSPASISTDGMPLSNPTSSYSPAVHTPTGSSPPESLQPPASTTPEGVSLSETPLPPSSVNHQPLSPENLASLQKLGEIRYSPWDLVLALAWSPGGEWLAVSAGEKVHVYDGQTFQEMQVLEVGKWAVSLDFAALDGRVYLALALKEGVVQLWDIPEGRRLCQIDAHLKGANSVAFRPDGRFLASTGNDGIVRLWDLSLLAESGACPEQPAAEMIGGAFAVSDVAFSPDGGAVASANARIVHLRDPITGRLIRTLYAEDSLFSIAFSPDGRWLAAAEMGGIARLWNVDSGEVLAALTRPEDQTPVSGNFLWSIGFSPDGQLLAGGSSDGLLIVWAFGQDPVLSVGMTGHTRAVTSLAFSPDGRQLATGSLDGSVFLWGVP